MRTNFNAISERKRSGLNYRHWHIHIHFAARAGHLDCVLCLLRVKKELATEVCSNNQLPLQYAVKDGHLEIVKILLLMHMKMEHQSKTVMATCLYSMHITLKL